MKSKIRYCEFPVDHTISKQKYGKKRLINLIYGVRNLPRAKRFVHVILTRKKSFTYYFRNQTNLIQKNKLRNYTANDIREIYSYAYT